MRIAQNALIELSGICIDPCVMGAFINTEPLLSKPNVTPFVKHDTHGKR